MTLDDYTALQDDGCPHCPDHVRSGGGYFVRLVTRTIRVETVLRLEDSPSHPPLPQPPKWYPAPRMPGVR